MKERLGMTDMRKFANRMNFGEIGDDVDQSDLGADLGQLTAKVQVGRVKCESLLLIKRRKSEYQKLFNRKLHVIIVQCVLALLVVPCLFLLVAAGMLIF